ncbi:hypothetical protein GCM10020254_62100 [Streptomyces goshikiensis]
MYSCATSPDGRYVFAGDSSSSVYCFDADGRRLWKLGTGGGSALSMQYLDERLYLVTTDGSLVCVDASEAAITAAQRGSVPVAVDVKSAAALPVFTPAASAAAVATVSVAAAPAGAVVVECVQQGGRMRVQVVSTGVRALVERAVPARDTGGRGPVRGRRAARVLGRLLPGARGDTPAGVTRRSAVRGTGRGTGRRRPRHRAGPEQAQVVAPGGPWAGMEKAAPSGSSSQVTYRTTGSLPRLRPRWMCRAPGGLYEAGPRPVHLDRFVVQDPGQRPGPDHRDQLYPVVVPAGAAPGGYDDLAAFESGMARRSGAPRRCLPSTHVLPPSAASGRSPSNTVGGHPLIQ